MAKITLMPSGINASITSSHRRKPGRRAKCTGWSAGACRRNSRFLRSVEISALTGEACTFTLTVRDLPASAEEWATLRDRWLKQLRRAGACRYHWVTEWTKRGVPHLHVVAYFEHVRDWSHWDPIDAWINLSRHLGAGLLGQHVKPMTHTSGWFEYVSKHASRGAGHYQRQMKSLPDTWDSVGRVWGKGGDWETSECDVEVSTEVFHTLRRLVRSFLVAKAKSDFKRELWYGDRHRIAAARRRIGHTKRMLRFNKKNLATVRGLAHWVSRDAQEALLSAAWTIEEDEARRDPIGQCRWGSGGVANAPQEATSGRDLSGQGTSPAKDRGGPDLQRAAQGDGKPHRGLRVETP